MKVGDKVKVIKLLNDSGLKITPIPEIVGKVGILKYINKKAKYLYHAEIDDLTIRHFKKGELRTIKKFTPIKPKITKNLDDYEEGTLSKVVKVRDKWYKLWLPKSIVCDYGYYIKTGKTITIMLDNMTIIGKDIK